MDFDIATPSLLGASQLSSEREEASWDTFQALIKNLPGNKSHQHWSGSREIKDVGHGAGVKMPNIAILI